MGNKKKKKNVKKFPEPTWEKPKHLPAEKTVEKADEVPAETVREAAAEAPAETVREAAAEIPAEKPRRRKRVRIHEVTAENDIRYRGPLNYQHFQILGWICIVATVTALLLKIGVRVEKSLSDQLGGVIKILSEVGEFSLPFLLLANFARILDDSEGYQGQLLKNIGASAAIAGLFYAFYYRYLVGGAAGLLEQPEQALPLVEAETMALAPNGFLAFNIFIDLLLCTLVMLFLNYRPKRIFRGKTVFFFRLLALLPIGYEVFCMFLKVRAAEGTALVPVWMYPLLPVKPVMTFVLFILLALFVKTRELRFRRHGKTHEEYQAFLKTNRNSLNFSIFLAVMTVFVCIIDLVLMAALSLHLSMPALIASEEKQAAIIEQAREEGATVTELAAGENSAPAREERVTVTEPAADENSTPEDQEDLTQEQIALLENNLKVSYAIGFGGTFNMIVLVPLMLLFSYTRKPKYKWVGMAIPAVGIAAIIIIFLEFFREAMYHLPFRKIRIEELRQMAIMILSSLE